MSDAPPLLLERDGAVAKLTLNRPAAANAINMSLARELMLAAMAETSRTPHGQEGVAAFISKRKPDFSR